MYVNTRSTHMHAHSGEILNYIMPMETEIVALGSQRPRNGRRMGSKELWTMADEPDSSRTPRFQLTSPRTKSRHGAFIVCRSK